MPNNAIIIINGQQGKNYLQNSLKKLGFSLVNVITPPSSQSSEEQVSQYTHYDCVVTIPDNSASSLDNLKAVFQNKEYTFVDAIATHHRDVELLDNIRELLGKPCNGEAFRHLNRQPMVAIKVLNDTLQTDSQTRVVPLAALSQATSEYSLPFVVKVVSHQQVLVTFKISDKTDIPLLLNKVKTYGKLDIALHVQPYYDVLYRLQTTTVDDKTQLVSVWREKHALKEILLSKDACELISTSDITSIFQDKLTEVCQQLAQGLQLSQGVGEFLLAFHQGQFVVLDYQLAMQNISQMEVMERVLGYSQLSHYLRQSSLISPTSHTEKEFKYIVAINLVVRSQGELLKLGTLPTYYRFYANHETSTELQQDRQIGALYLAHKNKGLVVASYASIRNREALASNPQFASHSAIHIVDFYRKAALNTRTDYTVSDDTLKDEGSELATLEEREALESLSHEGQHIPRYIKPLDSKANIQDIMRYYIDVYDLYILHGKAPGTKVIPINTGNPAFLPFKPIVKVLRDSLQHNLLGYARYSMQVPDTAFVSRITQYCQEEKILGAEQKLKTDNVVIGHGSTNLYYLSLKVLIKNKGDIVLITRPTYGLFIDPIYTAGGDVGFIDIKESDGWKVTPQNLEETISFYNQSAFNNYILNTFLKEYKKFLHAQKVFDLDETSLPPMPDVYALTDVRSFDSYIEHMNAYIDRIANPHVDKEDLTFSYPPRVRAFYHMNPHNPTGAVYTKGDLEAIANVIYPHPDIQVIDDLAHWGVLYGAVETATFAALDFMFERTVTLMSLSKAYCVPGLRAGVAIGNRALISEMQYRLLNSSSSATLPAMLALNAVFSTPKKERDLYLESNSREYFYRRNLMATLINGMHKTDLTYEQRIRIYQLVIENEYHEGKPIDRKFLKLLLSGMPLVRTLTDPKGCFFHLLDISKLIGAKIGGSTILTSTDVRNALFSVCSIDSVPGEISGNFFNYSLRLSFSLLPQQIYTACRNIHLFIGNYIVKHNRDILLKNNAVSADASVALLAENLDETMLNKAFVRFYLTHVKQSILAKHAQLFNENYLQHKARLHKLEQRLTDLDELAEKLLDPSLVHTVHQAIDKYVAKNESWLNKYLPDLEQLQRINETFLPVSVPENRTPELANF